MSKYVATIDAMRWLPKSLIDRPLVKLGLPRFGNAVLLSLAASLPALFASPASYAQDFPDGRLVRIVVPGPAGSSMDSSARAIADPLSKLWGVPVVVDNRPGGSTIIGTIEVAKAAADGHTLLYASTPIVQLPHLYRSVPFSPFTSFTPVIQAVNAPLWFAVGAQVPAKTVQEFVALAKTAPGKYTYGSPGSGSSPHILGSVLAKNAAIDLLHVPYKGTPPALNDVVAGEVSSLWAGYSVLAAQARAGKIRILASSGLARSSLTPTVPTMKEAGYSGFEAVGFEGFFAPAKTPQPVVDQIAQAVTKVMAMPEVKARIAGFGLEPVASSPPSFAKFVSGQSEIWKKVIVDGGVQLQ
ncbi:Bug family tripartite tricarboxylate transporter substrate binding protein [Herbaspirillum sp. GCM10030257]|uniref:Bug family tripartite tricarboxylate transporter substrate binding protein n=1 Tax=Herbaspirillum sp. GCM10030257 TaxID=3273393 RepID=UPI0036061742